MNQNERFSNYLEKVFGKQNQTKNALLHNINNNNEIIIKPTMVQENLALNHTGAFIKIF